MTGTHQPKHPDRPDRRCTAGPGAPAVRLHHGHRAQQAFWSSAAFSPAELLVRHTCADLPAALFPRQLRCCARAWRIAAADRQTRRWSRAVHAIPGILNRRLPASTPGRCAGTRAPGLQQQTTCRETHRDLELWMRFLATGVPSPSTSMPSPPTEGASERVRLRPARD